MSKPEVLIVGAGPTGMVLATSLRKQHIPFRIIDGLSGPGTQSRAMAVHARTLELYRPFGLADQAASDGVHTKKSHFRERGFDGKVFEVGEIPLGDVGKGLSRYPFVLSFAQDLHERLLQTNLERLGVNIERDTRLLSLHQMDDDHVSVAISGSHGEEKSSYKYVCGCDGAHSKVRQSVRVGFTGGTYDQTFYVTDVKLQEYSDDFILNLGAQTIAMRLPVRSTGMNRLVGLVPHDLLDKPDLNFEDLRSRVEELTDSRVVEVNWFSRYHAHHRVADQYRVGRVFLLGDAAHIHSPLGGQGMNTGIADAVNLGWKLSHVIKYEATPAILDSYQTERKSFGERLVATTDTVFSRIIQPGIIGFIIRRFIFPFVFTVAMKFSFTQRRAFKFLSQIHVSYDNSELSEGQVGSVRAGDRLPWVEYGDTDNFAAFDGTDWQLHVYGDANVELGDLSWIPLHRYAWDNTARNAGLRQDALYLVRPDGHVGLAIDKPDLSKLRLYLNKWNISAPTNEV